jgi:hypothetical protein
MKEVSFFCRKFIVVPFGICALCSALCIGSADADLRAGNSGTGRGGSYATAQLGAYGEARQTESQQEIIEKAQNSEELGLPVRVADMELARMIVAGNQSAVVTIAHLNACASIFPNGSFAWDSADVGTSSGVGCVAEVELRLDDGPNGIILARARVPAGGTINCNISAFPPASYTADAGKFTFPADREPTMDEVKKVMNAEQKQGAGLKIAAAALLGGLAGNLIGQNAPGKSGALGLSGDKMQKAAIGAVALGGLTAASTQAGKVGGDVIMGATINAVGGGLIGNISGIGNPVLLVRKCEDTKCLYGIAGATETASNAFYGISGSIQVCDRNITNSSDKVPTFSGCSGRHVASWKLECDGVTVNQNDRAEDIIKRIAEKCTEKYCLANGQIKKIDLGNSCGDSAEIFYKLENTTVLKTSEAVVIYGYDGGSKSKDWNEWKAGRKGVDIRKRYADGTIGSRLSGYELSAFQPLYESADDGAIVDLNNKARTGATATGAGVGGALGGFSAYQGATDEIQNRYASEVQAYKDSLGKIYCATGARFISHYNDVVVIPKLE